LPDGQNRIGARRPGGAARRTRPGGPAPERRPKAEDDLKRIRRTWTYESQSIAGRPIPEKLSVVIDGDLMTVEAAGLRYKGAFDPAARRRAIGLVSYGHPSGRRFIHKGTYEWAGGSLRWCFDNTGKDRPKAFESPKGKDNMYPAGLKKAK
jgi:uncharacterized protein (TIGR03067 family)